MILLLPLLLPVRKNLEWRRNPVYPSAKAVLASHADVPDPWYTRDFDRCCKDIYAGCEALLNSLV